MQNKGTLVILSGPSGSGKDTVLSELFKECPEICKSISMTTRAIRDGEVDGKDYIFVSKEEFNQAVENNQMLEYAEYGTNLYGTPKAPVDNWLSQGKTVVLKIEVQGAENIRKKYNDAVSIFIIPPSLEILKKRLMGRGSEDEESLNRRLNIAVDEIGRINEYEYVIVNGELSDAVRDIKTIIDAEKLKISRNSKLISEVKGNV
ncbi:MAG: guanylate kinase [Ruminococcus sp.]|nr:guanylate kinase [Candidatus Copronaster equi]